MPIKINPTLMTLFVICALVQFIVPSALIGVLPFILCAIAVGLIYYLEAPKLKRFTFIAYLALSIYDPEYVTFLPVILYAFVGEDPLTWSAPVILPYLFHLNRLIPFSHTTPLASKLFLSLVMVVLAFLLKHQLLRENQLKKALVQKADAMREIELHLNEKNQALMLHQDDEIHYATLNERNRIAREIHDHVGHQLSRVLLQIGAQLTLKPSDPALLSMKDTLDSAMDNLRKSVHNLHDTSVELETQLRQVTSGFEKCPLSMNLHLESEPHAKIKVALVAILKESLSNVSKHSSASLVKISLIEHPTFYQFIIYDNGTANHINVIDDLQNRGIGLKNIEQRVHELKGRFLIRTQTGFELFITLPKT